MILMFAVDENWGLGVEGGMLTEIRGDLKRFKEITTGNIVIMGRKTLEAIPGKEPLPDRINVVVTRQEDFHDEGFFILNDLDDIHKFLGKLNPENDKKVFVTGGESIARQLLPLCNKAYITKILKNFDDIDTYAPNLDILPNWSKVKESKVYTENGVKYKYVDYVRDKYQKEDANGV